MFYSTDDVAHVAATLTDESHTYRVFLWERIRGRVCLYSLAKSEGELAYALQRPDRSFVSLRGNLAWSVLNRTLMDCSDRQACVADA